MTKVTTPETPTPVVRLEKINARFWAAHFEPPIEAARLERVLRWIMELRNERATVTYDSGEDGSVGTVYHQLQRKHSSFRGKEDLQYYYNEHAAPVGYALNSQPAATPQEARQNIRAGREVESL